MAEITLVAHPGRATGSSESRRLRAAGRIPAVVYGHGIDATAVSVDGRDLRRALSGDSGLNQLLQLRVGEQNHLAMARMLQRHPVRHTVVHVDFQVVRRDEIISAEVPITLIGEAKAVEQEKGLIEQPLISLTINATPGAIPNAIEIDISGLGVGDAVRVGDLPLPEGVTTDLDPEEAVVIAAAGAVAAAEAEPEAAEGAEGAAAEGAQGAGPSEEG
jgi:large subunit ribosomal protein L25